MNINGTNVFIRNYKSKKRYVINRGGTRSSKTYSLSQLCVLWLYSGKIEHEGKHYETGILSIVRKHSTTLKATAMRDFESVIDELGIREYITINKTEKTYIFRGRTVEFFGADNEQKLRGGSRDILYCNEANELIRDQEFFQLMIRTKDKIFIDFNPDNEDIRINQELEIKRSMEVGDVEIIISTYKDNPFLPTLQKQEIERLEKTNPQYWKIYGLGEYGKLEGVIFTNWKSIHKVPDEAKFLGYGQDFGYTNDPTTLVGLYQYGDDIILDEMIYERGLTNSDIVKRYKSNNIDPYVEIFADSSEPKSIEEIYRLGYNIQPVKKGPDSIMYGLDILQQYQIYVTDRSINLKKEFKGYIWAKDKTGSNINKPVDFNNHAIDAARYVAMMTLGKKVENMIYFL